MAATSGSVQLGPPGTDERNFCVNYVYVYCKIIVKTKYCGFLKQQNSVNRQEIACFLLLG